MKEDWFMNNTEWAKDISEKILKKLLITADRIKDGTPHASVQGRYDTTDIQWWTNGFWPGILWLAYRQSGNEKFMEYARKCEDNLDSVLHGYVNTDHDLGFLWILASVADYKITGDEKARVRGLIAANYLAARFNLKGRFIRAWNGKGQENRAIIDCLMNLPLLYWASEQTEDERFKLIAEAHTETVINSFVRSDGSIRHIVDFDGETGEVAGIPQGQGFSPDSAWARGTAWAVYGFALAYKYTNNPKYLDMAKKTAYFFIANLPEDGVAYWDFRVPVNEDTPRDTSAAACCAAGLLEIADMADECEKHIYYNAAVKILRGITDKFGHLEDESDELIGGGTGHMPQKQNIMVGLIYGDYFYYEAILKLSGEKKIFW